MIFLYETTNGIEAHKDQNYAEQVLKLGSALRTISEQEWDSCKHRARMIGGELHLGDTEEEILYMQMIQAANVAWDYLTKTDYRVIKAYERGVPVDTLYEGESAKRETARQTIRKFENVQQSLVND